MADLPEQLRCDDRCERACRSQDHDQQQSQAAKART